MINRQALIDERQSQINQKLKIINMLREEKKDIKDEAMLADIEMKIQIKLDEISVISNQPLPEL